MTVPPDLETMPPRAPAPHPPAVTLCLHLGAHKTATTLIQARMAALGGRIGRRPFAWIDNQALKKPDWARWCRGRSQEGDPKASFAEAVAAWRRVPGGLVVVSSEDFLGGTAMFEGAGLYPEAEDRLGRFAELLEGHPDIAVRPLYHVRRTSAFVTSCLSQEIAKGRVVRRPDLPRVIRPTRFRWRRVIEAIEAAFGQTVPVRRYEAIATLGGHGFTLDFLTALGLPAPTALQRALPLGGLATLMPAGAERATHGLRALVRPNAALSERGLTMAEAIRPLVTDKEWSRIVRPFLARHFDAVRDGSGPATLKGRLAEKLDAEFEADIAWIGDRFSRCHAPLAREP